MRERGQTELEIVAMFEKIEVENRGKVEDWILDAIMSKGSQLTERGPTLMHSRRPRATRGSNISL